MDSEKEFKNILNEKLGEKDFHFDAENWEEARQMIDAAREEKKNRPFFYIILSAALLIVGGFAIYMFSSKTEENVVASAPEKKTSEGTAIHPSENGVEKKSSSPKISGTKNEVLSSPERTVAEKATNINNAPALEKTNAPAKSTTSSTKKSTPEKKVKANPSLNVSPESSVELTKNPSHESEDKVTVTTTSSKKRRKNKSTDVTKTTNDGSGNTAVNPVVKTTKDNDNKAEPVASETVVSSSPLETSASTPSVTVNTTNTSVATTEVTPEFTTAVTIPAKDTLAVASTSVTMVDSAVAVTQTPVKAPKVYHGFVSVEGGLNYFTGWKNPDKRDAKGYNPLIGINYTTKIHKPYTITVGAHYYSVGQLSYSSHFSKVTRYSHGEESRVTKITPTRLHYLGVPVIVGYEMNDKHSFGLGYNFGYLLTVTGKQETYLESIRGISDLKTSKVAGYTEGFRTFDSQLLLLYRRKIVDKLYVNTGFVIGLSDTKDNTFFNYNAYERNLGIRVTLTYNLFRL